MIVVTMTETHKKARWILSKAAAGVTVIFTRRGKPVAQLVPRRPLPESLDSTTTLQRENGIK